MWGLLTINKNTKFVLLSVHLSLQLLVFLSEVLPSMDGVRHLVQPAVRILQSLNCKFNQPYVLFSSPIPTYSAYFCRYLHLHSLTSMLSSLFSVVECVKRLNAILSQTASHPLAVHSPSPSPTLTHPLVSSAHTHTHTHTHTHCTKHSSSSFSSFSCHMCPVLLLRCQALLFFLLHVPMLCSIISPQPQLHPTRL